MSDSKDNKIVLIGDDRIKNIPIKECHDPFVNLKACTTNLRFVENNGSSYHLYAREKVASMLEEAAKLLPENYFLKIIECYRPLSIQKKIFDERIKMLNEKYPNWSSKDIYEECSRLIAPPETGGHPSGAALDLTLVNKENIEYEMGTLIDAEPDETKQAAYTNCDFISKESQKNRAILINVMGEVGFANYPTEWWHWSYGDRYWAYSLKKPFAIYSMYDGNPITQVSM